MRGRHKQGALPTNRMHSMWEFVFVAQFLRVFQGKFGFVNFTTEELENAFLESSSSALWAIFYDLVRILLPKRDIKKTTWQDALKEECEKRTPNWKPFDQGKRYETFSPEERVSFFYLLKFVFALTSAKVKPAGRDANNNVYWYFDDTRLYREVIGKKGQRSGWETVCVNLHDWDKLLSTFQKSTNSNEKKLYRYLKNELYPAVMPLAKEDEKETKLDQSHDQTSSKHKTERDAMVAYTADKVKKRKVIL
ncbi:PREDICTED: cat eye syndrome critical region protein 2-like [Acropora digitifera]|uniref:cat eye syndrome critical region protein 2-like n=1 Tax=Acropora digitifera TaxID=70779 RepID=UPI00077A1FD3|nr:PREDICTED: cat eye syndrome critical region protein 2-like [Acropora digitifera]